MNNYGEYIAEVTEFWSDAIKEITGTEPDEQVLRQAFETAVASGSMDGFIAEYGMNEADKQSQRATTRDRRNWSNDNAA